MVLTEKIGLASGKKLAKPKRQEFKDHKDVEDAFIISKCNSGIQFFFRIASQILRKGKELDAKGGKKTQRDDNTNRQSLDETARSGLN